MSLSSSPRSAYIRSYASARDCAVVHDDGAAAARAAEACRRAGAAWVTGDDVVQERALIALDTGSAPSIADAAHAAVRLPRRPSDRKRWVTTFRSLPLADQHAIAARVDETRVVGTLTTDAQVRILRAAITRHLTAARVRAMRERRALAPSA